jgi:hypothetical protein
VTGVWKRGVYAVVHGSGSIEALHEIEIGAEVQDYRSSNPHPMQGIDGPGGCIAVPTPDAIWKQLRTQNVELAVDPAHWLKKPAKMCAMGPRTPDDTTDPDRGLDKHCPQPP